MRNIYGAGLLEIRFAFYRYAFDYTLSLSEKLNEITVILKQLKTEKTLN
ncbi:hypothetical protein NMS_2160 [Nonlabens marinus S1-08]|uniref:Uncharacterized protein n=1 Tax=Nonlabens marinus S1-08 TaxID=1454201 RepID=W8VRC1_9FLAO|nr:hypothetical protein NMS_2160 [Nonlabens marinus S1-08]